MNLVAGNSAVGKEGSGLKDCDWELVKLSTQGKTKWKVEAGRSKVEDGRWNVEGGRWKVERRR